MGVWETWALNRRSELQSERSCAVKRATHTKIRGNGAETILDNTMNCLLRAFLSHYRPEQIIQLSVVLVFWRTFTKFATGSGCRGGLTLDRTRSLEKPRDQCRGSRLFLKQRAVFLLILQSRMLMVLGHRVTEGLRTG